jgi:hypothetical protein
VYTTERRRTRRDRSRSDPSNPLFALSVRTGSYGTLCAPKRNPMQRKNSPRTPLPNLTSSVFYAIRRTKPRAAFPPEIGNPLSALESERKVEKKRESATDGHDNDRCIVRACGHRIVRSPSTYRDGLSAGMRNVTYVRVTR